MNDGHFIMTQMCYGCSRLSDDHISSGKMFSPKKIKGGTKKGKRRRSHPKEEVTL